MLTGIIFHRLKLIIGALVLFSAICASFAAAIGDTSFQWFTRTWDETVLLLGMAAIGWFWVFIHRGGGWRLVLAIALTPVGLSAVVGQYYQPFFHVTRWLVLCALVVMLVIYMRALLGLWPKSEEDEELAHKS